MSNFNYPIQIDSSVYTKTLSDLDYNRIIDYLEANTDWDITLKKVRNNLKLGIEDKSITNKAFEYSLLVRYFSNLSNYCRKATTEERNTLYCNFVSCLESISICKSNPKIIRDLADLLCLPHTVTINTCCASYTYDISNYDIINFDSSDCLDYDDITTVNVAPSSGIQLLDFTLDNYEGCNSVNYNMTGSFASSSSFIAMFNLFPPSSPINNTTKFILSTTGSLVSGRAFTLNGAKLDSSWNFNSSHEKQFLSPFRRYLIRYINNEWYIDDVDNDKYKNVNILTVQYDTSTSGIQNFILKGGINYSLQVWDVDNYGIYLDDPIYNKGLYIKVYIVSMYGSNPLVFKSGANSWDLVTSPSGGILEWYSDGINWILQ